MKPTEFLSATSFAILMAFPCALVADHIPGLYNTGVNDDTSIRGSAQGDWEAHYSLGSPSNAGPAHSVPVSGVDGVIRVDAPILGDQSYYRLVTVP